MAAASCPHHALSAEGLARDYKPVDEMGANRTGCGGCVTILILLFALGLMAEAWEGQGTAGRGLMVVIGVVVLGGLWLAGHAVVTSAAFKAKAAKKPRAWGHEERLSGQLLDCAGKSAAQRKPLDTW